MPDIYVYNGTSKTIDLTTSFYDVMTQRAPLVPPGSQGHFAVDQPAVDAVIAQLSRYGVVPHSSVANPAAFSGASHSTSAPISIGGKTPPVVELKPPAKPPLAQKAGQK